MIARRSTSASSKYSLALVLDRRWTIPTRRSGKRRAPELRGGERSADLHGHSARRQQRRTEPRRDQLGDSREGGHLGPLADCGAGLATHVDCLVAHAVSLFEQQDVEPLQSGRRQVSSTGEGVLLMNEQDELLPVEGQLYGLGRTAGQGHHEQVQASRLECRQERACHGFGDLGHESRKARPERLEDRRQQVRCDGRYHPESQRSVVNLSRASGVRHKFVERGKRVVGQRQELLTEGREDHAPRSALEKLGSEARLERGNRGGNRRLGDREVVGRGAEMPLVGDSSECAKLNDGRICHKVNLSSNVDSLLCSIGFCRAKWYLRRIQTQGETPCLV